MNKMRIIKWTMVQCMCVALILLTIIGHGGAENALKFFAVFLSILGILGSLSDEVKTKCRRYGRSVPAIVSHSLGILYVTFYAWSGWFFVATLALFYEFCEAVIFNGENDE